MSPVELHFDWCCTYSTSPRYARALPHLKSRGCSQLRSDTCSPSWKAQKWVPAGTVNPAMVTGSVATLGGGDGGQAWGARVRVRGGGGRVDGAPVCVMARVQHADHKSPGVRLALMWFVVRVVGSFVRQPLPPQAPCTLVGVCVGGGDGVVERMGMMQGSTQRAA